MSLAKKFLSPLRNAFSYAVHLESAADHARKDVPLEKLMAQSLPAPDGADADYAARLRRMLERTRTKHLETLVERGVRVVLDARLPQQRLSRGDRRIDGIFYDTPGAAVIAVWDEGRKLSPWKDDTPASHGPTMLEKLAVCLKAGTTGTLYASRFTTVDAAPGMGPLGHVTTTEWKTAAGFEPGAIEKNPALREPLKRPRGIADSLKP